MPKDLLISTVSFLAYKISKMKCFVNLITKIETNFMCFLMYVYSIKTTNDMDVLN